jgi:gentisate 1,2-dioxygenase
MLIDSHHQKRRRRPMTLTTPEVRSRALLLDTSGTLPSGPRAWAPVKISRAEIEAEMERLADLPRPANGRRAAEFVHPESTEPGIGLAPGVAVTLEVLLPGEQTTPIRENAGLVEICIQGRGRIHVNDTTIQLGRLDVCNIPSMKGYWFVNDGSELWARLSYSNRPLLDKLGVHYVEELPLTWTPSRAAERPIDVKYTRHTAPDILVSDTGARLRGYEFLVDIEVVENEALHWPWQHVSEHLMQAPGDGKRPIMALYNPATERRNGATHSFFVTASMVPKGAPARPRGRGHRHTSVAINYHFAGRGESEVGGQTITWEAGDLLLSAPAWMEHAHYQDPEHGLGIFTVQDHPQQIGLESLVWQEDVEGPVLALGSEQGQTGYIGPRQAGA